MKDETCILTVLISTTVGRQSERYQPTSRGGKLENTSIFYLFLSLCPRGQLQLFCRRRRKQRQRRGISRRRKTHLLQTKDITNSIMEKKITGSDACFKTRNLLCGHFDVLHAPWCSFINRCQCAQWSSQVQPVRLEHDVNMSLAGISLHEAYSL